MAFPPFSRRTFAAQAAIWAGTALATGAGARRAFAAPTFLNDPFQLGVAAGDPVPDGFMIWTRLAPDPYDAKALPPEAIPVGWEVAADPKFQKRVASGTAYAQPHLAHSVHVDVKGLEHGRPYYYRFHCGAAVSRTGRAMTLSTPRMPLQKLKFAFASCQHYEQGYFTAFRDMIAQDPDFILHLGDYIYESSWGTTVRQMPGAEARTLDQYRLLHAVYKADPDLQNAHAHCAHFFMWDDHEAANDYSRLESDRDRDPAAFLARRAAAYQAYYEHMPLRPSAMPQADGMTLYKRVDFGDLMDMAICDLRQYRDPIPCQTADKHMGQVVDVAKCPEIFDANRTMLGKEQERSLTGGWARTNAKWNVLAQTLMFAGFDQMEGPGRGIFTDNWGGYPAAKRKILDLVKKRNKDYGQQNFICLGGDIHSFFVSDVKDDDLNPNSETLMTEFVCTSVTSESYNTAVFAALLKENPQMKFIDDTVRGYVLCEVTPQTWTSTLRMVENVRVREPKFRTRAKFVVESGRAGAQSA